MPLWYFVEHTASPGSFSFAINCMYLDTMLCCICSYHTRLKKEKIKHCFLKLSNSLTYLYHSYQESLLARQGTVIFEIAKLASYLPKQAGTNFSRHWKKLSTIKEKSATLSVKTEKPKVGEYLFTCKFIWEISMCLCSFWVRCVSIRFASAKSDKSVKNLLEVYSLL